ncbi:hypothetical protein AGOR_G00016430 [Albula goreensis]|uniref:ubiquitinyl hydrolase 1 n=1 Tax=Albula goreensis TaxID=1534307 RepID=A0A8T3E7R3_9TELE|nr:hypothetical protein AGOR_G00016430 [Albula goreensis]
MAEEGAPHLDTQREKVAALLKTPLRKGDTWYLVDSCWFKQWKKYVGFDSWDKYQIGDQNVYPGPVDNSGLFKDGDVLALKEHLIDELDYILVPTEGWNKLVNWYGLMDSQEPIARKVIEQGMFVKHCKVEVYLTELKLCEDSNMDNVVTRCFSKADTIVTIEKEMRKLFRIPDEKETRLWNKYMSNTFEPLSKLSSTVQDAGLFHGQVLVIEQKNEDGTWPRGSSAPKSKHKTSHSLELGHDKKGPRKQSMQELEDLVLDKLQNVLVIEQKNEDGTWPRGSSAPKNEHKTSHSLELAHYKEGPRKQSVQELEDVALDKLPNICSHYNRGNGEHGSCRFTDCCSSLHVCQHFLQDNCKFGAQCKRAHKFDATAIKILNGRGVYLDLHTLHLMYKKMLAFTAQANGPTKKCVQVHYHLPYRWQVLDKDGSTWKDLPDMESIEQAYCNPANNSSKGISQVDFLSMTSGAFTVRRLSTASSVTKPPHFILTTDWLWYWKNDEGAWSEFGSGAYAKAKTSITSKTLENAYLADTDSEMLFNADRHIYILSYKDMSQQNIVSKTKREIRRRPRFVSGLEVEKQLKSGTPEASGSSAMRVPEHWDKDALPDVDYKLIPLSDSSTEFQQVELLFKRTMSRSTIRRILRIQNPSLYRVFQWQKELMQKKNEGKGVDQQLLFHGTDWSLVSAICEQNFDWRICGIHGTHYGKGSYFARDASYSDRYSKSSDRGTKSMFVVQVLVGEYTKGDRSYLRPPPKGSKQGFYDSCVDSVTNPTIFVIFEKHQIYPEYIIEYS